MESISEKIVVIDFGGRYSQLMARTIRELGVYSELHPYTVTAEQLQEMNPKAIVLTGEKSRVAHDKVDSFDERIFELNVPMLFIGYGMQLLAEQFHGKVSASLTHRFREETIMIKTASPLFAGLANEQVVWSGDGDFIELAPEQFVVDALNDTHHIMAMSHESRPLYGIQFHPEVEQSQSGTDMLKNFIFDICQCAGNWSMSNFIQVEIEKIRQQVGDKKVLCALSGGVDSSVVAVLIQKAIGDQLTCMFIDHGLLRKGEAESVMQTFGETFQMNVIKIDAKDRFLRKLAGVSDPEQKRKIIGNEFIYVFEEEAAKLTDMDFLAQGTLYTDIIESGTATTQTIKSHHNVGGLPEDMTFELIEPLKMLFKDEVRKLGTELGISDEIVWRQPFPGPGLGIRVLGEITEEKLQIVRESDAILREEIKNAGLERDIWQYFTVLPDVRSVGVTGDKRTYDYTIGIRAVTSVDGMTSEWAKIPFEVLELISTRIVNEVEHINRVVYDITSKPPATIEWE